MYSIHGLAQDRFSSINWRIMDAKNNRTFIERIRDVVQNIPRMKIALCSCLFSFFSHANVCVYILYVRDASPLPLLSLTHMPPLLPPFPDGQGREGGGDRERKKGNRNKEGGGDGNNGQSEEEVKSAFSPFSSSPPLVRGAAYAAFATTAAVAMMLQPQRRRRRRRDRGAKATTTTTTTTFSSAFPEKGGRKGCCIACSNIYGREGEYLIKIVFLLALRRNEKKVHFLSSGVLFSILTNPSRSSFTSSSLARMAPESKRRRSIERMEL